MIKLINDARRIHRILVLVITSLILVMVLTGTLLKYTVISEIIPFIDLGMVRYVHNNISPFLSLVLLLMAVTGLLMYFSPFLIKIFPKKTTEQNKV